MKITESRRCIKLKQVIVMFLITTLFFCNLLYVTGIKYDTNGFVLYCPCMGRFGNQADHFLGALSFAKGLNRTLVLPPWVEYEPGKVLSTQIPFDRYFRADAVQAFHKAMTMEHFMKTLAPTIWPVGQRKVYCYMERHGSVKNSCNAKDGNPFGSFWNTFNIDFDDSVFYGPLSYNTQNAHIASEWNKRFPASTHLVLAFTGAPADFPVSEENVKLQKYLVWSDYIQQQVDNFISKNILEVPYLGIHLRHGSDWKNACQHVKEDGMKSMFGSAQCLGYHNEYGTLTPDICYPPEKVVLKQVESTVKRTGVKVLFVASDDNKMISKFEKLLKKHDVKVVQFPKAEPHVELALLAKADYYIGNCVSTFSHFATRERLANSKSSEFWAFTKPREDL